MVHREDNLEHGPGESLCSHDADTNEDDQDMNIVHQRDDDGSNYGWSVTMSWLLI